MRSGIKPDEEFSLYDYNVKALKRKRKATVFSENAVVKNAQNLRLEFVVIAFEMRNRQAPHRQ